MHGQMGKRLDSISPELASFIEAQRIFFVATAPLSQDGHINLSPKGLDSFRILSPTRVTYLDLTGSGNETAAHVSENSRITLMFCSFEKQPMILRIYGRGQVVLPSSPLWPDLITKFTDQIGIRQIIDVQITSVQTSCGFGVPLLQYGGNRDALTRWAEAKGPQGLRDYRRAKNSRSIDGLPAPPID
jgi:hypothetical protein